MSPLSPFAHWLHLVVALAWHQDTSSGPFTRYIRERVSLHRWGLRGVAVGSLMHEREEFLWKEVWRS